MRLSAGLVLLAGLALGAGPAPRAAADDVGEAGSATPASPLPSAAFLRRVVWSDSTGLTRIGFRADQRLEPRVERPRPDLLRVDLTATGAGAVPRRLEVGTRQVVAVSRIPDSAVGLLPEGVSARFLVHLADTDAEWAVVPESDGFTLLVGTADAVRERARSATEPAPSPWIDAAGAAAREEPPAPDDRIDPQPFVVAADQPVRAAPSALSPVLDQVRQGDGRVADARRGGWLHLASGGWLRHALPVAGMAPGTEVPAGRVRPPVGGGVAPATWSVLTLGTGLAIELREPTAAEAEVVSALGRLFAVPVRVAVFTVAARGSPQYSFRFPPKAGRVVVELPGGRRLESPDPLELPRVAGATEEDVRRAFPTAELGAGQAWSGLVLLPADAPLDEVEAAWVDVGGRLHRLFEVPAGGADVGE